MSNKILIYITVALIIVLGVVAGTYFVKENKLPDNELEKEETIIPSNGLEDNKSGFSGNETGPEAQEEENLLVKDDFSIKVPEGWRETTALQGISAMIINVNEEITDPNVKKINFRSYFSVSYDSLQERGMEEYVEYTKNSLSQVIPGIVFTHQEAQAIEAEITQQGVDFKVLIVFVKGVEEEDVWVISFNTVKGNWDGYKDLFYEIAESFKVKI